MSQWEKIGRGRVNRDPQLSLIRSRIIDWAGRDADAWFWVAVAKVADVVEFVGGGA